jgi:hypothetical protein
MPLSMVIEKFQSPQRRAIEKKIVVAMVGFENFQSMQIFGHHRVYDQKNSIVARFGD